MLFSNALSVRGLDARAAVASYGDSLASKPQNYDSEQHICNYVLIITNFLSHIIVCLCTFDINNPLVITTTTDNITIISKALILEIPLRFTKSMMGHGGRRGVG